MFYRWLKNDVRLPIDLTDVFAGQECFIAGGGPALRDFASLLDGYRHTSILAINNAATTVPASLWIGGDRPDCYDKPILVNPAIMKFARKTLRSSLIDGKPWQEQPNTFFFDVKEGFKSANLLCHDRALAWWKNTFYMALQLAYRLGFRTAYLVGCGFKISKEQQYAWKTALSESEVSANVRLYNDSVAKLAELKPHFDEVGFKVVSATPESLANGILPYEDPKSVLDRLRARVPASNTEALPHSLRKE